MGKEAKGGGEQWLRRGFRGGFWGSCEKLGCEAWKGPALPERPGVAGGAAVLRCAAAGGQTCGSQPAASMTFQHTA